MRKLCCLLLVFLFTASVSTAQKKVRTRKNPDTPVWINTPSGKKLPVPAMRPMAPAPQARTFSPRPKVTMRNRRAADTGDFIKVTRRIPVDTKGKSNQRGTPTFKDLHIYYPKKANQKKNTSTQRRMASYPSITISSQADVNNFNTNYPNCDEVGTLIIAGSGISNLATMTNIGRVDELIIRNTSLTSLSNLQGLSAVTDSLVLENNGSLSSIGLSNVDELGGLYIRGCSSLQTVGPFGSSLTEIANDVFLENSAVTSLSGLSGVTSIGGDLNISSTPLTTLNELNNLDHISSYLFLDGNNNMTSIVLPSLTFLRGIVLWNMPLISTLGNLTTNLTETNFYSIGLGYMDALTDISGLNRLTSVSNIYVVGCHQLTSLNGLENLTSARYGISLYDNNLLSDITALSQITTVEYDMVEVAWNSSLSSLSGLGSITKMDALWIAGNSQLTSLNALNPGLEIYNVNGDDLQVYGNSQLTVCSVPAICNYLNSSNAVDPQIHSNGPSCGDLSEVMASCGSAPGCGVLVDITWTGDNDDEWDNPLNWSPNGVPDECSRVIIPTDMNQYPYVSSGNDISIGGLVMMSSDLDLNGGNLFVGDSVNLSGANIYAGTITMTGSVNPRIIFSHLDAYAVNIVSYRGGSYFYGNSVYGDLSISDVPSRTSVSYTFGNDVSGNFTFTNRSNDPQNYLSNGNEMADEISGDLIINNNTMASLSIGLGSDEPLSVAGDVYLNGNITTDPFYVEKITFFDSNDQSLHLNFPGSNVFEINELYLRKYYSSYLRLTKDLKVNRKLVMGNGSGAIKTESAKMLIVGDTCVLVDEDPLGGSFVDGPMKKIGNTAFTFPIGNIPSPANRGKNPDAEQAGQRGGPVVIYNKAPLSISAPTETNASFIAEYSKSNPLYNGYDTAFHDAGTGTIQTGEYWKLTRESGASNVVVSLNYNDTRLNDNFTPASLQVTGWDGSKWVNWGNGGTTGTAQRGMVSSASPLTTYGPLALAVQEVRKPIVTITPFDSMVCVGKTLMVHFTLDTSALPGNIFRVQLSDKDGSFDAGTTILGSKTSTGSDSILVTVPTSLITGSSYRIRVTGTQPEMISANAPILIPQSKPTLAFTIEGMNEVCVGTGVTKYFLSEKEEGATYNWTVTRGTLTVDNDTAFVTFTSAGTATIQVTPTNNCGNGTAVSRSVTVKPAAPSTAPELTNTGRRLIASAPPSGQVVTSHAWYQNGALISGETTSTLYVPQAGTYTVGYANDCGVSPISNGITFANASIPQTITFDDIPNKVYGDEPFNLPAISNSELPVGYKILSGPGNVTAGVYTITYSGTVVIQAYQLGDNQYDTAAPVTKSFVISKSPQTITFDSLPDYDFKGKSSSFQLTGTASSGKTITYTSSSENISISYSRVYVNGLGNVTITASQAGDTNYLAATPVRRTFCVRNMKLNPISGAQYLCPGNQAVYKTNKITGLTYSWRLSDGTTFASIADSVKITWPAAGTYTLIVSATGPCGPATANDSLTVNVMVASVAPDAVTNMLPANGSIGLKLPMVLSWIPGNHTLSYDIYVWEEGQSKPTNPFASNITAINYTLQPASLAYDKTYNWQVVSKNGCLQTSGPVQTFTLRKLADLMVSDIQIPATANSGQNITINWKVKNIGGGITTTNENWNDAVFLSFDTMPAFNSAVMGGLPWGALDFPVKPMLIGTKKNVAALGIGEEYTNSIDVTLPRDVSQPLYVYVITNYKGGINAPLDANPLNDTARALNPIAITLTPTPDLRVDTVLVPATVFSGSTINVTYKVTNYGVLTPAGSIWTDKLYISKSPLFNKEQAVALKAPKQNETYYRSTDIAVVNSQQLEHDQSITKNVEAVIPNFISGTWFIHVVTNEGGVLYEGPFASNNDNNHVIQIILTPTPQFSINSVNLPVSQLSNTQPVGINWNVTNTGSFDNIEKNKGFYGSTIGMCSSLGDSYFARNQSGNLNAAARSGGTGSVTFYPLEHDSLSWGSSYWVDKVYLSTNPSGLNVGTALYLGQATKGIKDLGWLMPDDVRQSGIHCGPTHGGVPGGTISNVLRPGSNHPNSFNFKVPADLPEGDYYFYIQTNSTNTVFTYPNAPVIARSEKVTVSWPDLVAASVTVPSAITGGVPFTFEYSVGNNGPGSVYDANRVDKIYMSNTSVFDGSATIVKTLNVKESIASGSSAQQSISLSLPHGTSGTRYFFVEVNAGKAFKEKSFTNNISGGTSSDVTSAPAADLAVTSVAVPGIVEAPGLQNIKLFYTVKNNSSNTAHGKTIDSIYISCNPVFSPSTAVFLTANTTTRSLSAGESITDSVNIFLNRQAYLLKSCFTTADISNTYFIVKVNGNSGIYEAGDTANNFGESDEKMIVNRNVDLTVSSVSGGENAIVGRPYRIDWDVTNIAANSPDLNMDRFDSIYFSKYPVFNEHAIGVHRYRNSAKLPSATPVTFTQTFLLPKIDAGDYYVYVLTNATNSIPFELNRSNNVSFIKDESGNAKKINVVKPLLSDLVSEIISAPEAVAVGQPFTYTYRVTNAGSGVTYPDKWNDQVWLNTGIFQNPRHSVDGTMLSSDMRTGNLEAGASYEITRKVTLPLDAVAGNYLLSAYADRGNAVVESIDSNNVGWKPLTVYVPDPSDLIVESVSAPDTIYLGYTIDSVRWVVKNNSVNTARGVSTDGIYLSQTATFDSNAVLVGIKNKNIDLNPLASDTLALAPLVNNIPEGNYYVIVRTDLLNNIHESDKANNDAHTIKQVYVSVKELRLGITEPDILEKERYYKLVIPDSLNGSTILLTLKSKDSLTARNEMYVGKDYVPSVANFDHNFNTPNYGNQQILIADVAAGVHYISVRRVSPNPPAQNITLSAVRLPFAILNVKSDKGGNGGNVTVKLTGSLFADSMTAKLSNGATTIHASQVYFVNSTLAYATFPLQGKPIGVYDIILTKTDNSEAILGGGFSVVSPNNGGLYSGGGVNTGPTGPGSEPGCDPGALAGLNSQLVTEIIIPDKVFGGWPFVIQINYSNPTNMDIPVQSRILYNDAGLPMTLTKGEEASGNTSALYIELSDADGPPGVFRAGSIGTITIYSVAPVSTPPHTFVNFILK